MQIKAYMKENGDFSKLFEILKEQRQGLIELKEKFGNIVTPDQL